MKTVCEMINEAKEFVQVDDKINAMKMLDSIEKSCDRMESRLLKYYRAIERLGFKRCDKWTNMI